MSEQETEDRKRLKAEVQRWLDDWIGWYGDIREDAFFPPGSLAVEAYRAGRIIALREVLTLLRGEHRP